MEEVGKPKGPVPVPHPVEIKNPQNLPTRKTYRILCEGCGEIITKRPSGPPFSDGPYKGGYICSDCTTLELASRPHELADAASRAFVSKEAERIKAQRAMGKRELLFEEGQSKVYLTARGTVLFDLERMPFGGPTEFDPARLMVLWHALRAVCKKLPEYSMEGVAREAS